LDTNDWKRLGLPVEIEEAIREELTKKTKKSPSAQKGLGGGMQLKMGSSPKAGVAARRNNQEDEDEIPHDKDREKKLAQKGKGKSSAPPPKAAAKKKPLIQAVDDNKSGQHEEGGVSPHSSDEWDIESTVSPKSKGQTRDKPRKDKVNPSTNITQLDTKVSIKNEKPSNGNNGEDDEIDQLLESLEDGGK